MALVGLFSFQAFCRERVGVSLNFEKHETVVLRKDIKEQSD